MGSELTYPDNLHSPIVFHPQPWPKNLFQNQRPLFSLLLRNHRLPPYSLPSSRKLKYPVRLKMMWSSSPMPTIAPAALSWPVMFFVHVPLLGNLRRPFSEI